jgi:uncharacterized protein YegP (UPF0339 family)
MALAKPTFETFEGVDGRYYWRLKARNGKVIATGGEGYAGLGGVENAVFTLIGTVQAGYYEIKFLQYADKDHSDERTP